MLTSRIYCKRNVLTFVCLLFQIFLERICVGNKLLLNFPGGEGWFDIAILMKTKLSALTDDFGFVNFG